MRQLIAPAALLLAASSYGQTLVLDTFSDTDRIGGLNGSSTNSSTPIGTPTATNTQWISNRPSQLVASSTGMLWTMDSQSRLITGYFPQVTLQPGVATTFRLSFTTGASGASASNLRIALTDGTANGIRTTEQPSSSDDSYSGDTGYAFFSGTSTVGGGNTSNTTFNTRERTTLSNNILGTASDWGATALASSPGAATGYLAGNTSYTFSYTFTLAPDSSSVAISTSYAGGNLSGYTWLATDSTSPTTKFDQFHFRLGGGSGQFASINFTEFSVTAIPEPSTYAALAGLAGLGLAAWRRRRAR